MTSLLVNSVYDSEEHDDVYDNTTENVETMKAGDEEEKVGVLRRPVFVDRHIGTLHIIDFIVEKRNGFVSRNRRFVFLSFIGDQRKALNISCCLSVWYFFSQEILSICLHGDVTGRTMNEVTPFPGL